MDRLSSAFMTGLVAAIGIVIAAVGIFTVMFLATTAYVYLGVIGAVLVAFIGIVVLLTALIYTLESIPG